MMEALGANPAAIALILAGALAAGFIDAVAGGGGLITTPLLLLALPGAPLPAVLATTKCASIAGTAGAAFSYSRSRQAHLPWRLLIPGMACALPASWLGARWVFRLDPALLRPIILALLIAMAAYTALRPKLGQAGAGGLNPQWDPLGGALVGAALGFYDGFFGPGTGSILVLLLITVFGRDFLRASAAAKFINLASNLGALLWFAPMGAVLWALAIPMAACNLVGGMLGSRMAVRAGNRWIRAVFLAVVLALIARLGWAMYGPA